MSKILCKQIKFFVIIVEINIDYKFIFKLHNKIEIFNLSLTSNLAKVKIASKVKRERSGKLIFKNGLLARLLNLFNTL